VQVDYDRIKVIKNPGLKGRFQISASEFISVSFIEIFKKTSDVNFLRYKIHLIFKGQTKTLHLLGKF